MSDKMKESLTKGNDYGPNEDDVWCAGISTQMWANRIEVYGYSAEEAAQLRDSILSAWQAAQAEQSVPVVGDVVEWQYRWLNPEEFTGQPASLLEWQRVIPYPSQSNEKRLEELLAYRSHGKACYEIRALIVQPTHSITTAELERMRKDAEQVQFPSCTTCVNRGRVNGLSQETYCDWCLWQGQGYRVNHYAPQPKKEGK